MDYSLMTYPEDSMRIRKKWFRRKWQVLITVVVGTMSVITREVVAAEFGSQGEAQRWLWDHIMRAS